jgi:glutamate/tyrosine decarboxylase-like PLP-dependent enzyme
MAANHIQADMRSQLSNKNLFEQAKAYAFEYIDTLNQWPVYPSDESLANLSQFDEPVPETIQDWHDVLHQLHAIGSPATVRQTGGRYFGFVNGNVVTTAAAAGWMAQVWDQNAALYVMSPISAKLEQVCERWCADLLGLAPDTALGLVGGSSVASMCGLAAGRNVLLEKQGWDVNANGLFGAPPIRVVVNEQAHGSVWKGLALLGLGNQRVEKAPADEQGRIIVEKMPKIDGNTLLILQAGHVSTGSFDHFDEICDFANSVGAWVHIDGAFGLWAAASSNLDHLTKGMEKADSWAVDGHKTLNTPYDCGIVLCKDRTALNTAMAATGSYLQQSGDRDGMLYTPDMSRRARSIELWATLKYLGRQGVEQLIDGMFARAKDFGEQLRAAEFHVQNDIVFNQYLIKCDSAEETASTMAHLQNLRRCGAVGQFGRENQQFELACALGPQRTNMSQSALSSLCWHGKKQEGDADKLDYLENDIYSSIIKPKQMNIEQVCSSGLTSSSAR